MDKFCSSLEFDKSGGLDREGAYFKFWLREEGLKREEQDRNQIFSPIFARGPWPETFKASFSQTNQRAIK